MNAACAAAHGCRVDELGWVNTLFVGTGVHGLGVGRLLLETVVADLREHDLRPCPEVLAVHDAAARLYVAAGWREVHRLRRDHAPGTNGTSSRRGPPTGGGGPRSTGRSRRGLRNDA
ncbi:MAG: hypothetical protein J0I34_23485 [Pseudonocardia sp.]|uniref:hypothetical protein n=1 Tax=unclassified Pseudonocardia TaxID=2619320 RepID=UPI000868ADDB|nr:MULTISPECIES: hypothetical protein [unclassified Pseudonocardia]MBN9111735.1 hypothetical protein [Pseudonocardia sp.]ODU25530.1 MAG: hypothetical protein ABS80_09725 [Pseudonocardia sp. SCN 72-51]ODV02317.1 MAG: hypothetical protein ABT15_25920 [Pseudonocardia sp. SCN 73-27]